MSVSVEKLEHSMAKLTIEVSAEELEQAIERTYQKQKGKISAPGFRKGKMPRALIEKMYGEGIFYEDAANDLINRTYPQEAENCGEDVVSAPQIAVTQLKAGKPFIYTAEVALKPPVSLGKYKGVEVEKQDTEVTDEEVDAEIKKELEKNAKYNDVTDRAVKDGDMITLDFEGFVDGEAFKGGKGESYPLTIGSHSFIPGFEEQLVGAEIDVEKDVNVTFPEDYQAEELKGKAAVFKCTVKAIREKILPELDDAFADEVSEFSTLAEYKDDVKKNLTVKKEQAAKTAKENAVVDAIIADASMELPEPMIKAQQDQMVDEFAQRMQMQGLSIDQYFQYTGSTREKMEEELKPQAEKRIKTRLVLEQVVKDENIEATEEDFEEEIKKMAESYKMEADKIKELFDEKSKKQMMQDLAVQKAVTFVTEAATEK
ncbi:MAG: trigger factor [Eubacteriales bacterium]|nr:trigger factor [Eubacteriales bacterium]